MDFFQTRAVVERFGRDFIDLRAEGKVGQGCVSTEEAVALDGPTAPDIGFFEGGLVLVAEHAVCAVVLPVGELQRRLAVFNLEGLQCTHIAECPRADGVDGGGDDELGQGVEAGEGGGVDLLERGGQLQRLGCSAGLEGAFFDGRHAFGNSDGLYVLAARECALADVAHVRAEGEGLNARAVGERLGGDGDGLASDGELLHGTVATEQSVALDGPAAPDVNLL